MFTKMSEKEWSGEQFLSPQSCYRGAPFWAWNCYITKEMIDEQIPYFKQMGMGGFHIHVRVGLKNQYMDDAFLDLVRYCKEKAEENGLLCWLYDEDRYSSGIAGGEVTKQMEFRARKLLLTVEKREEMLSSHELFLQKLHRNEKVPGCLLRTYDILLEEGWLTEARILDPGAAAKGTKWYLYEVLEEETGWCNNQTYVDTMNGRATEMFIRKTHEKYAAMLQEDFGKSVPAIFTDEPHITGMHLPGLADGLEDSTLPFTEELPRKYKEVCGLDFYRAIPDILWNRKDSEVSWERYSFFETCCELFTDSYCRPVGDWCAAHGILSTGHILGEESLGSQAVNVGEAMRCYREFQLPGIDNLCDCREFSAVKQASSAAHQYGREGVLSELYGVTQWDFDFRGYKLAGDWQAALGITVRVPHLAWASMAGEAKRDYPAAIGWQSPWFADFSYIEDHFARVNYCLTRGKPVVHVGVIHPIETMWLYQGPAEQMGNRWEQLETDFRNLTEWILTGGIDFDFIAESSLEASEEPRMEKGFVCGAMTYDVILVPDCLTLRKTTFRCLENFSGNGGKVILCGTKPKFIDCVPDEKWNGYRDSCEWVPLSKSALLDALEPWREIAVRGADGSRRDIYLHQMRREKDCRWLFLAQAYKGMQSREIAAWKKRPLHDPEQITIRLKGTWQIEKMDTLTGDIHALPSRIKGNDTVLPYAMYGDDSLLLRLLPVKDMISHEAGGQTAAQCGIRRPEEPGGIHGQEEPGGIHRQEEPGGIHRREKPAAAWRYLPDPFRYEMSEPNACLLDRFEYALDEDPEYKEERELLKLDNRVRQRLGYPLRCEAVEQPYVRTQPDTREHLLHIRIRFPSALELPGCRLVMEEPQYCFGTLNGREIDMSPVGFYVDKALQSVALPVIQEGENELLLHIRYGNAANLEWMYITGEFGVRVLGDKKLLIRKPERLFWGDYTRQGFPFYTGNMKYYVLVNVGKDSKPQIQIPYYSGAAVKAAVQGEKEEILAFLPCKCSPDGWKEGENVLILTCLGNRFNGFGQLHWIGDDLDWVGPDSWRTEGTSWTDGYQLKKMGILSAPLLIEGE